VNLWEKQAAFSEDLSYLIQEINRSNYRAVIGEVERTPEQAEIYAQRGVGIKDSLHLKKLAADIHLFDKNTGALIQSYVIYKTFGDWWEKAHPHNRWGGNFKRIDSCHFERVDI
jgi:hypothetical protein